MNDLEEQEIRRTERELIAEWVQGIALGEPDDKTRTILLMLADGALRGDYLPEAANQEDDGTAPRVVR